MDIFYRGILDKSHSWGVVATELCLALERKGFGIKMSDPVHKDVWDPARVDPRLQTKLNSNTDCDFALSYCVPPNLKALPKVPRAHIYNYEFSVIPTGWKELINENVQLFLPSSAFARDIFLNNGVRPEITEVLPHGIDLGKYNPQIAPVDLGTKKFVFLCVSSPHLRKGLDVLLEAFGEEFATTEPVELVIKTSIPQKLQGFEVDIRKVLDSVRNKHLALPQVRVVTDYYPSLAPLYRAAHCYVSPNHSECFGLTELEAVCCGLPIIVTGYGGYLDFLTNENSFLVQYDLAYAPRAMQYWHANDKSKCANPRKLHLRQQMRYVFNNYKIAQQKARIAYEQIAPKYTWDKVADRFIELAGKYKILDPSNYRTITKQVPVGVLAPKMAVTPDKEPLATEKEKLDALRASLVPVVSTELIDVTDTQPLKLSSFSIVLNEEHNIAELLDNIYEIFDEIVLVDGGSTDGTLREINHFIRAKGTDKIKLFTRQQNDLIRYSAKWNQADQRNYALDQCTGDWVMMLDADERLDFAFRSRVRQLIASGRSKAYAFAKYHYWEALDVIRTDGWWFPNYSYRLWKNNEGVKYEQKARHCQPIIASLGVPPVISVKDYKDHGYLTKHIIHHLHYLKQSTNELRLYRANDKDVRTIEELKQGLETRKVPSLHAALRGNAIVDTSDPNGKNALFFCEQFKIYSGGRYHLFQEAYSLAKAGVNVYFVSNLTPLYINDYPKLTNFKVFENWAIPPGIKFDFVVGTPANCGARAVNYSKKHSIPCVLVSLETPNFIKQYRGGVDSEESHWNEFKQALPSADVVFCSAELPAKALTEWVNVPREKIELMPPAINDFAFKRIGDIKKANTLIYVSRIVEHKKFDNLLDAVGRFQRKSPHAPTLDIIGAGNPVGIDRLLKQSKVKARFYANISDIAKFQLIKRSSGLVSPSIYEGFGMSPIEGLQCNVPVVCYDLPIFHETVGDTITYVPLNDVNGLAAAIEKLIVEPETFTHKTQQGFNLVSARYSLQAMVSRWRSVLINRLFPSSTTVTTLTPQRPRFSVCIIALNEAEYLRSTLDQVYHWDACHEIIIVEGSDRLYPKEHLSPDGLSGDGTTEIIRNYPDPKKKIKYISGVYTDKIEQRNEYAKRITGNYALILDADEFYTRDDLDRIVQDAEANPEVELFTFDFSHDLSQRTYYHLWYNFQQHVLGGYWDIPHNRIYKWTPGTLYKDGDHNHPVKPNGAKMIAPRVKALASRAKCIHTGFAKSVRNQKDKNKYYQDRGEGKESNPELRARRQMYIDCRLAYENWVPGKGLPHDASVLAFGAPLPEVLKMHEYYSDPSILLRERNR